MQEIKFTDVLGLYLRIGCGWKTARTKRVDASCADDLVKFFRGLYLTFDPCPRHKTITGAKVREYRELRKREGVAPVTIMRRLAVASAAVRWGITEMDYAIPNPFQGRLISREDRLTVKPRMRVATPQEESAMLLAAEQPLKDIIQFYLETGVRVTEAIRLDRGRAVGSQMVFTPDTQKSRKHGVSALNDTAMAIIARQPVIDGQPIFTKDSERIAYRTLNWMWCKAREKAAMTVPSCVDLQIRDLRRTFGVRARDRGVPIEAIAAQMRNTIRVCEKNYAQPSIESALMAVTT